MSADAYVSPCALLAACEGGTCSSCAAENQIDACKHGASLALCRILQENSTNNDIVFAVCIALANILCDGTMSYGRAA